MSKLNKEEMKELNLINDNKIQSIIIKLSAEVPRELRLRQYLDNNRRDGIDMKESILRIFEGVDTNINTNKLIDTNTNQEYIKITEQSNEVAADDFDVI